METPPPKPRKPFKYPLGFDEFLRFLMPQKRPEDRRRIFKVWVRQCLREHRHFQKWGGMQSINVTPVPSDEDVSAGLDEWKAKSLNEEQASFSAPHFREWLGNYTALNFRNRAKKAATARWSRKQKKNRS